MGSHTQQFLDEICARHGRAPTGYAVAKIMGDRYGWSRQTAFNYRKGSTAPDDRKALDIAQELELEPMYVIACIQADRAADPELRSLWEGLAEKARGAAAAVILSALAGLGLAPDSGRASVGYDATGADRAIVPVIHYAHFLAGLVRRLLVRVVGELESATADVGA